MQNLDIQKAMTAWSPLAGALFVPNTEEECNRIVALLDELIDEVGEDETHPLASLMEVLGVLIEHYEAAHLPELAPEIKIDSQVQTAEVAAAGGAGNQVSDGLRNELGGSKEKRPASQHEESLVPKVRLLGSYKTARQPASRQNKGQNAAACSTGT